MGSGRVSAGSAASRRRVRLVTCGTSGGSPSAGRGTGRGGAGVGGPAGLDRDDVGGVRADGQRRLDPGDDVGGGHVPVQQQDLDQGAGRRRARRPRGGPLTRAPRARR